MIVKDSNVEEIMYNIHRDCPHLKLKKALEAYHSVKHFNHELKLDIGRLSFYSKKKSATQVIIIILNAEKIIFERKGGDIFKIKFAGDGELKKSVVETCAKHEMKKVKEDIYFIQDKILLYAEPHLDGYLLKDTEDGNAYRYLSCTRAYELYATRPHKEIEGKILILGGV